MGTAVCSCVLGLLLLENILQSKFIRLAYIFLTCCTKLFKKKKTCNVVPVCWSKDQ